jgi:hypothetical protein
MKQAASRFSGFLLGFFYCVLGWSGTESVITEASKRPTVPAPNDDECGAIGGMLGRWNSLTRRKPGTVSLCPPQIPHYLTRARTRSAEMGRWRVTAWATARPSCLAYSSAIKHTKIYTRRLNSLLRVVIFQTSFRNKLLHGKTGRVS